MNKKFICIYYVLTAHSETFRYFTHKKVTKLHWIQMPQETMHIFIKYITHLNKTWILFVNLGQLLVSFWSNLAITVRTHTYKVWYNLKENIACDEEYST